MKLIGMATAVLLAVLLVAGCTDRGEDPPSQPPPAPGALTATPASVTVGPGQAVNVTISGGTPPYAIDDPPDAAFATAALQNPAAEPATLVITGVTVASAAGSTSVKVKDSAPSPENEVRVQITKMP